MEILFIHSGYEFPQSRVKAFEALVPQADFVEDFINGLKAKRDSVKYTVDKQGVATINVEGPIVSEVPLWAVYYDVPMTGTWNLLKTVNAAIADKEVESLHFNVNSPGGTSLGLEEAALAIFNSPKWTSGHSFKGAYSAGYWLLSQCDEVTCSTSTDLGSLGSYIAISDYSKMFEKAGVKQHVISSGGVKGLGVPGTELTNEQIKYLETKVQEGTSAFKAAVQRGRGINLDKHFTGEWWNAETSVKMGLADKIVSGANGMATEKKASDSEVKANSQTQETGPDITNKLDSLTKTVESLAGVVTGLVSGIQAKEKEIQFSNFVESGMINQAEVETARELFNSVGAETFGKLMSLRPGIKAHPNPDTSGGADLRDGNAVEMAQSDADILRSWGVDPSIVAKYGDVQTIDIFSREITKQNGKKETWDLKGISAVSDEFTINGVPNKRLQERQIQKAIEGMGI